MSLTSLTLLDYSDKELIGVVRDLCEESEEGWAWTSNIAKRLALDSDNPNANVGIRMAWLKRYGIVERHEAGRRWQLTAVGQVFLDGKINVRVEDALDRMEPGEQFTVVRMMAGAQRQAIKPVGHMLRREWRHGTQSR